MALTSLDLTNNWTTLTLDYNFNPISFASYSVVVSDTNTGLNVVSRFKNSTWNSGIFYNGIFSGGQFFGGIFYSGVFSGTWGE